MSKIRVYVAYKESILDPQAQAIKGAAHKKGYAEITDLHVGKYFDFEVAVDVAVAEEKIVEIANSMLANPNMETYKVEVLEA